MESRRGKFVVRGTALPPRTPMNQPARSGRVYTRREPQAPQGTDKTWRERAACLEADPELFFSDSDTDAAAAAAVCATCPVMAECFAWAMSVRIPYGVWGSVDFGADIKPWSSKTNGLSVPAYVEMALNDGKLCADIVSELGYKNPESLDRVLYRAGRRDLVRALHPGSTNQEDIGPAIGKRGQNKPRPAKAEKTTVVNVELPEPQPVNA